MKKVIKYIAIFLVASLGFVIFVLSHNIAGIRAFVITSGSMAPAIPTGSLILTTYVHPIFLRKNDMITFIAPIKEHTIVTHRIQSITTRGGVTVIGTKGDANKYNDIWHLAGGGVIGKVIYVIPYIGYFLVFTRTKIGISIFILLPAFYIIYSELGVIYQLMKRRSLAKEIAHSTTKIFLVMFLLLPPLFYSKSLLSSSATLTGNQFEVDVTCQKGIRPGTNDSFKRFCHLNRNVVCCRHEDDGHGEDGD